VRSSGAVEILDGVDPAVAGALIGFAGASVVGLGTQQMAARREFQRLEQQFRHARRLKDDDDTRAVVDEALAAAHEAEGATLDFNRVMVEAKAAVERLDEALAAAHEAEGATSDYMRGLAEGRAAHERAAVERLVPSGTDDAMAAMEASSRRMDVARSRLMIRLSPGHPLTEAYVGVHIAVVEARRKRSLTPPESGASVTSVVIAFAQLAHEWAARPVE
jgi:hypothetical protein